MAIESNEKWLHSMTARWYDQKSLTTQQYAMSTRWPLRGPCCNVQVNSNAIRSSWYALSSSIVQPLSLAPNEQALNERSSLKTSPLCMMGIFCLGKLQRLENRHPATSCGRQSWHTPRSSSPTNMNWLAVSIQSLQFSALLACPLEMRSDSEALPSSQRHIIANKKLSNRNVLGKEIGWNSGEDSPYSRCCTARQGRLSRQLADYMLVYTTYNVQTTNFVPTKYLPHKNASILFKFRRESLCCFFKIKKLMFVFAYWPRLSNAQ